MKNIITVFIMSAIFFSYSQLTYASAKCREVCDGNYDKCVASVINLPLPRTADEQDTLDACDDKRNVCYHSCEDTNEPTVDQPQQEEGK
jgi:hypothetical protein